MNLGVNATVKNANAEVKRLSDRINEPMKAIQSSIEELNRVMDLQNRWMSISVRPIHKDADGVKDFIAKSRELASCGTACLSANVLSDINDYNRRLDHFAEGRGETAEEENHLKDSISRALKATGEDVFARIHAEFVNVTAAITDCSSVLIDKIAEVVESVSQLHQVSQETLESSKSQAKSSSVWSFAAIVIAVLTLIATIIGKVSGQSSSLDCNVVGVLSNGTDMVCHKLEELEYSILTNSRRCTQREIDELSCEIRKSAMMLSDDLVK